MKYFIKSLPNKNKKDKLFLCTRDIAIGDMVYPPIEERFDPTIPMLCIEESVTPPKNTKIVRLSWVIEGKWYKVIGEVFSNLLIKEGMEFERNDFEMRWTNSQGENSLTKSKVYFNHDEPKLIAYFKKTLKIENNYE